MSAITPRTNQNILSEPTRPTRNLIAVLYAICGLLIAINLLGFVAFLRPALAGRSDFRIFYTAGYLIRTGNAHALYDEQKQLAVQNEKISYAPFPLLFNHAPYEALLFVPFSFLRYRYAYSAFGILNALLLLVVFKRIRRGNVAPGPNCRWMQL
ncbi:MAG TPA: hypothetical protein VFO34_08340, partial [Candidatus Acidoferrales bacterium]|nr:hypothetical protein [Candidatus Acidoferrales bacterium]